MNEKIDYHPLKIKMLKIKNMGWILSDENNNSSAGYLLERLLGLQNHNFEIPDFNGIEIKTKISRKEKYLSLFNATPDGFVLESKRILESYGYPDKNYPEYKVFNMSFYSNYNKKYGNKYFDLCVDRDKKQVIMNVYDISYNLIDANTSWSFEMLQEKLERKLKHLLFVKVLKRKNANKYYFKYNHFDFYKLKSFDYFIDLIEQGEIKISFSIGIYKTKEKLGKMYDHGTHFSLNLDYLEKLFDLVEC